jgi:hypothetical protein
MTKQCLVSTIIAVGLLGAAAAGAQTPPEACVRDSLRLVSPEAIGITLAQTGRFGATITWPDPDDAVTTCAVPRDTAGLGFEFFLDGEYKDKFDREIELICLVGGEVGSRTRNSVLFAWSNRKEAVTGRILGEINLSNNGGAFGYGEAAGTWTQINSGLPAYMSRTDFLALAEAPSSPGKLIAHLSGRVARGLWLRPDPSSDWRRLAPEVFPDGQIEDIALTALAFHPEDAQTFVVGTVKSGVYITRDGGATFTQLQSQFAVGGTWNQRRVTALNWAQAGRLLVAINGLGLFASTDSGSTFTPYTSLRVPVIFPVGGGTTTPSVRSIVNEGSRLLVGVQNYGVYVSADNGLTWSWAWDDLLTSGATPITVTALATDPAAPNVFMAGTASSGIWWSGNAGRDWSRLESALSWPNPLARSPINSLLLDTANGRYVAAASGYGLLTCDRGDTLWTDDGIAQPSINTLQKLILSGLADVDYWLGSINGGIYEPGTAIRLTDTIKRNLTADPYKDLDFGLTIAFGPGTVADNTRFYLVMQDYQGFAVWRTEVAGDQDMELIGLYDKNNPESCIEGYCGDSSYNLTPNCYVDKRSACFDFRTPGQISFFDDSSTAMASPGSLTAEQLFSARFENDPLTVFPGDGNLKRFYVTRDAADPSGDAEIYAYPNPLRQGTGFTGSEGEDVRFKNLPTGSAIQVFTLDGDIVAELGSELQVGDIIAWKTRNTSGELLSSGVYIYKVTIPERDAFFGKVVLIR